MKSIVYFHIKNSTNLPSLMHGRSVFILFHTISKADLPSSTIALCKTQNLLQDIGRLVVRSPSHQNAPSKVLMSSKGAILACVFERSEPICCELRRHKGTYALIWTLLKSYFCNSYFSGYQLHSTCRMTFFLASRYCHHVPCSPWFTLGSEIYTTIDVTRLIWPRQNGYQFASRTADFQRLKTHFPKNGLQRL